MHPYLLRNVNSTGCTLYVAIYGIMGPKYKIKLIHIYNEIVDHPMYLPELSGQHFEPDEASV